MSFKTEAAGDAPRDRDAGRRKFLQFLAAGVGAIGATIVAAPVVAYVFAPLFGSTRPKWRDVGQVDLFTVGETSLVSFDNASHRAWSGTTAKTGAWLRRTGAAEFIAFSLNCTHLGCPVRWEAGPELFMCPCHGGVYYKDGGVAAGPPPEPLHRYPVRVRGGRVEVRTTPLPIT
jgi:menaquinol-cytochrome c reductase iron-sulfur subunit